MTAQLTVREQRFVNNFVGSDAGVYWRINLERDLASYRYPHTAAVRAAVKKLQGDYNATGTFTPLPETIS